MSFQSQDFGRWMEAEDYKRSTRYAHNWQLNHIDPLIGGIDEYIEQNGIGGLLEWIKTANQGPFETYPAQARSAMRRYVEFLVSKQASEDEAEDADEDEIDTETAPALFKIEKEMQAAVRGQLGALEDGLVAIDDGKEVHVATGKIDILARDAAGRFVVIELKVGKCPSGALEQTLGYAEALSKERNEAVRAILIAGEFSDRTRAAAKRTVELELKTYEYKMAFHTPI